MANKYILQLDIDESGAIQSIDKVDAKLQRTQAKIAGNTNGPAGKTKGAFSELEQGADQLDNLFGKLGGSSAAVADGFKVLRTAMIGSGIGAIVVLVGELINNFDLLASAIDGVSSDQAKAAEEAKKAAEASKQQLDFLNEIDNLLKIQGKNEKEILKIKIDQSEIAIQSLEASIEQQNVIAQTQIQAAQRNKDILAGLLKFLTAPLQALAIQVDLVGKAIGQNFGLSDLLNEGLTSVAGAIFDPEQIAQDAKASIDEAERNIVRLKSQKAGFILQVKELDKKAAQDAKAARDRETQEELKDLEERNKKRLELVSQQAELEKTVRDREAAILDDRAKNYDKLAKRQVDATFKVAQAEADTAARIEANNKAANEGRLEATQSTLGAILALNEAFAGTNEKQARRAFAINKALSITQAVIDTYKSANAIFASASASPATIAFPAYPFVMAGTAVAAGLANVAKIAKQQFQSGNTGAGSSPTPSFGNAGGGGTTPSAGFQPINFDFLSNRPKQATPVYTLASDVKSSMEARQKIDDRARL